MRSARGCLLIVERAAAFALTGALAAGAALAAAWCPVGGPARLELRHVSPQGDPCPTPSLGSEVTRDADPPLPQG